MLAPTPKSPEEAVSRLLDQSFQNWHTPTAADSLERSTILEGFESIQKSHRAVFGVSSLEAVAMADAYEQSVAFVHNSFDEFEKGEKGGKSTDKYNWAFLVPARGRHASEVTDFLPVLDEQYGANPSQVHRIVSHLSPTKIESYQGTDDTRGMILYVPAYFDTNRPADRSQMYQELIAARRRTSEAAHFARVRHGVGLVGLGAVLPGVTQFGNKITEEGLVTTTGHGETVYLMSRIADEVIKNMPYEPNVGMLGLGSIGSSCFDVINQSPTRGHIRRMGLYDVDRDAVNRTLAQAEGTDVFMPSSEVDLLRQSDVIIAAVTTTIDLDAVEELENRPIDLQGKVIIDDSQPGCFDRAQVEARGGKLIWVVGSDWSESGFLHREGNYHYGDETGLSGERAVWGCEAEVGALAIQSRPDLAVGSRVTPQIAREIGKVCHDAGIRAAWPPQSYGQPVEF
jgi:hypothetical protein